MIVYYRPLQSPLKAVKQVVPKLEERLERFMVAWCIRKTVTLIMKSVPGSSELPVSLQ